MKKIILLAAIAVFGFTTLSAQEVKFGAKAGVNFSDITGDNVDSFDGLTGFHVGGMAEFMISDKFSIQPEIMYSAQGSDYKDDYDGEYTEEGSVKFDYLNFPVMGKYYITEGLSAQAGVQVGFLWCATWEYDFMGDSGEENIKDEIKGTDFGVNFGLGYKLDNGINFAARYNLGLTDNLDSDDFETEGAQYKNSVIQLSVGYFF